MVFGKTPTDDDSQNTQWKKKYYDSLDDLEFKEDQWQQIEKLLRNALVRISLAVGSDNEHLTKLLNTLRNDIREGTESLNLRAQLEKITHIIRELDTSTESTTDSNYSAKKLVDECIERVQWSEKARQFKRGLARQFNRINDDDVRNFIHSFTKLINQEFIWYKQDLDNLRGEKPLTKEIGEEFFSENIIEDKADKCSIVEVDEQHLTHDDEKELSMEYSVLLLSFLKNIPSELIDASKIRQLQLKATSSQTRQQALETIELIVSSMSANKVTSDTQNFSSSTVNLLIEFLELISLPDDLSVKAEDIRQTLISNPEKLKECLADTVELVMSLQQAFKDERKALEEFLSELGIRLQEIDNEIKNLSGISNKRSDNFNKMKGSVDETADSINDFIENEVDIDSLKANVKSHVIMIRHHMDTYLSFDNQQQSYSDDVVRQLATDLIKVKREAEALRQQLEQRRLQATHDTLTRIPNRLAYDEWIRQELDRFTKYDTPFVLMVWDVDFFKRVNDGFGHQAGDKVLRIIAQMLAENIREADFVARYGGEEFVVVLPGTLLTAAMSIAENTRKAIQACAFHFRDKPVKVTASAGICEIRAGETVEMLFERADKALYKAKNSGRNVCIAG